MRCDGEEAPGGELRGLHRERRGTPLPAERLEVIEGRKVE